MVPLHASLLIALIKDLFLVDHLELIYLLLICAVVLVGCESLLLLLDLAVGLVT